MTPSMPGAENMVCRAQNQQTSSEAGNKVHTLANTGRTGLRAVCERLQIMVEPATTSRRSFSTSHFATCRKAHAISTR